MEKYDLIIVGAGPAGIFTAVELLRHGSKKKMLLVEKGKPVEKRHAAHPEVNFLGCEVFVAGVGALAKRLDEMGLENVRIVRHDAVEIVRDMIPENSLAGVHIYFPDPWRKARHHKRRLVAQPFIGMLASRIRPGGYIHCATDWENYSEQMLEVLEGEPLLENLHGKLRSRLVTLILKWSNLLFISIVAILLIFSLRASRFLQHTCAVVRLAELSVKAFSYIR